MFARIILYMCVCMSLSLSIHIYMCVCVCVCVCVNGTKGYIYREYQRHKISLNTQRHTDATKAVSPALKRLVYITNAKWAAVYESDTDFGGGYLVVGVYVRCSTCAHIPPTSYVFIQQQHIPQQHVPQYHTQL